MAAADVPPGRSQDLRAILDLESGRPEVVGLPVRRALWTAGAAAGAAVAGIAGTLWASRDVRTAMGARPSGERAERVRRSPQFRDGAFRNQQATSVVPASGGASVLREMLTGRAARKPGGEIPVVRPLPAPPTGPGELHVTWYGHATALVEIEGARLLVDPVWSARCSPSRLVGPRRLHPMPLAVHEVPTVDAVVISHDHYDHLDLATVRALVATQVAPFVVPLGVGAHLERWGVPAERIVELDWGEEARVAGITLTATAARHFSGRTFARDYTLWGSWVIAGPTRRLYYTGDSGYFDGYAGIGEKHGPFDATLVQVGAYAPSWPDIHMTPEEAVAAHQDLRGGLLIPVHWATFVLAFHPWAEPVDRLWREAKARDVTLAVPRPGERVDVTDPPAVAGWWQALTP
jgi:L-ascorbate metabolism protein UlaG (beta-lactamase superfamily)